MSTPHRVASFLLAGFGLACSSEPLGDAGPGKPSDDALAVAEAIGTGDGSAGSVTFTVVFEPAPGAAVLIPTDLAFNSARPDELWVALRRPPVEAPCTEAGLESADAAEVQRTELGCAALAGRVAVIRGADGGAPQHELEQDDNAWHFMRRPSGLAFGAGDTFATCGEARTANYEDEAAPFNGPVLWSSDPAIFGAPGQMPTNSTHLDMLHSTPYCMGIAHELDNVYWAFNGDAGALDRYDFHEPHVPGADDHSDGELWRFAVGEVKRVQNVPSHLVFDASTQQLYVADSGNGRIARLNTRAGTPAEDVVTYDNIETHVRMAGVSLETVVGNELLSTPSGLALHRGVLFVTDHQTSRIHAFDSAGRTLRTLDTGLASGSLGAVELAPDGTAYVTDLSAGRVLRIDP